MRLNGAKLTTRRKLFDFFSFFFFNFFFFNFFFNFFFLNKKRGKKLQVPVAFSKKGLKKKLFNPFLESTNGEEPEQRKIFDLIWSDKVL